MAFKLSPTPSGEWAEKILYAFTGSFSEALDGAGPSSVIRGPGGNLYGATGGGGDPTCGNGGCGVVFELTPGKESVLHSFTGPDGELPLAPLISDSAGNLYGTTYLGGTGCGGPGCGTAFELQRMPDGTWKEIILHNFGSFTGDGEEPFSALIIDRAGNLYGTTAIGGTGTVFTLRRGENGSWKETILYNFPPNGDGVYPEGSVVLDAAGNLYGTTNEGGDPKCNCGVVYKLSPCKDGTWMYTVLHRFTGYPNGPDGGRPQTGLILDDKGNLYGTTSAGGLYGDGVVFEVTP
jgi:uncharacterized repeat protein (TIGR03803 family)